MDNEKLNELLEKPLDSPDYIATMLQNIPAAKTYLYEQMNILDQKMRQRILEMREENGGRSIPDSRLKSDEEYGLLLEHKQEVKRMFFELEETSSNLRSVLSYQVKMMNLDK